MFLSAHGRKSKNHFVIFFKQYYLLYLFFIIFDWNGVKAIGWNKKKPGTKYLLVFIFRPRKRKYAIQI